ncbi:hypothetical protein DVH24_002956 [Malus domestica]|uniref:Uncharacterized protein n=1 Tax=Malus domestica TaxID=3750 RepID=A0A498K660_MALDO|nr:hypothetical protein DVH24_002956 [Malus domestica]
MGSSGLSTRGGEKRRGRLGGGQIEEEDPVDKREKGSSILHFAEFGGCGLRIWVRKKEMRAVIYEDAAVVLGWSGEVVEQGEQSSKALRSRAEQRS